MEIVKLEWVWHNPHQLPGTHHVQGVKMGLTRGVTKMVKYETENIVLLLL